jgi:signal transduction histidine kinase/HAMP domain-containing protein
VRNRQIPPADFSANQRIAMPLTGFLAQADINLTSMGRWPMSLLRSEIPRGVSVNTNTRKSRSLRVRLIQLVLLALLPALGLIIYSAREQRKDAALFAENEALRLARILSASHQRLIDSTGYLLVALARIPEIRKRERDGCIALLSDLIREYPPYSNLAVAGVNGEVFCHAREAEKLTNIADRSYFQRAIRERDLSIGEYQIGRATGTAGLNVGYPVLDGRGGVAGVVFAAIDLAWFNQMASVAELPEGSTLTLYDRQGTVLARHPESDQWVGKAAGESRIFAAVFAAAEGVVEATGLDEKKRLYGFTSFGASSGKRDIYLAIGIPLEVAFARADWTLTVNLIALLIVSVLAVLAAWYAGDALILRRLGVLLSATARLAAGHLNTRTGLPHGNDEIGRLAASFDKMAESLEVNRAEADSVDQRTQESLARIKALHEIDVAITSTLDLRAMLDVLLEKIDLVLPGAVTTILLIDKESGELVPVASRNIDEKRWRAGNLKQQHGLARDILDRKLPVVTVNLRADLRSESRQFAEQFDLVSCLGVPLIAKGELLGLIAFYTKEEHSFGAEEKDFLVTLSGQLAIAIHNAQLYDETRRRGSEIAALHALTLAANQSLDLDLILQEAIKKITEIFSFAAIRVFLLDRSMENLELRAAYEAQPRFRAEVSYFRRGQGIVGKVTETGESFIFDDILHDQRYAEISQSRNAIKAGTRFTAFLPIKSKVKTWGTMVCVGEDPRKLKASEVKLLESMTNQLGIAVENSSLYQQTAAKARELSSLYAIAGVASESLDISVVLQTTMAKVLEIFDFDAARIYLCDDERRELHLAAAQGFPPDVRLVEKYRAGETRIGKAFETGEPSFVENMETDPEYYHTASNRIMFKAGFRSSFIVPLKIRGSGLGVMNFLKRKPCRFSESDRQLIHSIAYHLGIAVGNANLYSKIKEKTLELETANQAKDEFLGVMSHELRTPLNVIKGYAEVTKERTFGDLNSEQEYALEKISSHANDLAHMINSILQVTTIEANTVKIERRELNPCDLLDELRSDYLVRANKQLSIFWDYPPYLPMLETDDEKLRAILQNLVNNALKFTENGSITITARHVLDTEAIEFKVSDTGTGISADKLPSIFDMFKQADSSATRRHDGVGLGLYIVKKFVDLLGGKISVQSKLGEGSTFVVDLPLRDARRDPRDPTAER